MKITLAQGDYDAAIDYMTQLNEYAKNSTEFLSILDIAESFTQQLGNIKNPQKVVNQIYINKCKRQFEDGRLS